MNGSDKTLRTIIKLLLPIAIQLSSKETLAKAEFGSLDYYKEIIAKYEATGDESVIAYVFFNVIGEHPEIMDWLDSKSQKDPNVIYPAANAFKSSNNPKYKLKAEALFLRHHRIYPELAGASKNLADMYLEGDGVQKDTKKACEWFEKSYKIKQNFSTAEQYGICLLPYSDRGFRSSETEACEAFAVASEGHTKFLEASGNPTRLMFSWAASRAFGFYGECLYSDTSGVKNPTKGFKYLKKAFDLKHPHFSFLYASRLESGEGVIRDPQGAVKAYTKAAEYGSEIAQNTLGVIHAEGKIVKKDLVEAYKWFLIAAAGGYENAVENRKAAENKINQSDIKRAEDSAKQWRAKYLNR
jgi:TPR repeat protein